MADDGQKTDKFESMHYGRAGAGRNWREKLSNGFLIDPRGFSIDTLTATEEHSQKYAKERLDILCRNLKNYKGFGDDAANSTFEVALLSLKQAMLDHDLSGYPTDPKAASALDNDLMGLFSKHKTSSGYNVHRFRKDLPDVMRAHGVEFKAPEENYTDHNFFKDIKSQYRIDFTGNLGNDMIGQYEYLQSKGELFVSDQSAFNDIIYKHANAYHKKMPDENGVPYTRASVDAAIKRDIAAQGLDVRFHPKGVPAQAPALNASAMPAIRSRVDGTLIGPDGNVIDVSAPAPLRDNFASQAAGVSVPAADIRPSYCSDSLALDGIATLPASIQASGFSNGTFDGEVETRNLSELGDSLSVARVRDDNDDIIAYQIHGGDVSKGVHVDPATFHAAVGDAAYLKISYAFNDLERGAAQTPCPVQADLSPSTP